MEKFSGRTTDITLKNDHIWGCAVYVLDERFQGYISGINKWEPCSLAGIFLGHSDDDVILDGRPLSFKR